MAPASVLWHWGIRGCGYVVEMAGVSSSARRGRVCGTGGARSRFLVHHYVGDARAIVHHLYIWDCTTGQLAKVLEGPKSGLVDISVCLDHVGTCV